MNQPSRCSTEHTPSLMTTKTTTASRIFYSIIMLPMMSAGLSIDHVDTINVLPVPTEGVSITTSISEDAIIEQIRKERAQAIDDYFASRNLPLAGYGMKMVIEAEKNGLDWRLIPAIGMRESTGGKFACKSADYSPFGFGSCRIDFDSYDHAIEVVARNLGGNNPRTKGSYANKTLVQKLKSYNSVIPTYTKEIFSIMNKISPDA